MFSESFSIKWYGYESFNTDCAVCRKNNARLTELTEIDTISIRRLKTWDKSKLVFMRTFTDGLNDFIRIDALQEVLECFQQYP